MLVLDTNTIQVYHGDCFAVLPTLPENSVDAMVTDPPYHLTSIVQRFGGASAKPAKPEGAGGAYARLSAGFMAQKWDGGDIAFRPETWAAMLRVLKPGAYAIIFGGERTYHRMACAVEDAGFIVRFMLVWVQAQGFPKSLDIGKQFDKMAGVERNIVGQYRVSGNALTPIKDKGGTYAVGAPNSPPGYLPITVPATDLARQWDGWGSQLKPAASPILLAQKPLSEPNIAANVARWGCGALNIAATRIPTNSEHITAGHADSIRRGTFKEHDGWDRPWKQDAEAHACRREATLERANTQGRWPSNLLLSHADRCRREGTKQVANWICAEGCPITLLDAQAGPSSTTGRRSERSRNAAVDNTAFGTNNHRSTEYPGEGGNVSRFFMQFPAQDEGPVPFIYCPKASKADREGEGVVDNIHPTVKPTSLMAYLIRLVVPPGATVLDPFLGSGTTAVACIQEGVHCIGIEREARYIDIAKARIEHVGQQTNLAPLEAPRPKPKPSRVNPAQMSLFGD